MYLHSLPGRRNRVRRGVPRPHPVSVNRRSTESFGFPGGHVMRQRGSPVSSRFRFRGHFGSGTGFGYEEASAITFFATGFAFGVGFGAGFGAFGADFTGFFGTDFAGAFVAFFAGDFFAGGEGTSAPASLLKRSRSSNVAVSVPLPSDMVPKHTGRRGRRQPVVAARSPRARRGGRRPGKRLRSPSGTL